MPSLPTTCSLRTVSDNSSPQQHGRPRARASRRMSWPERVSARRAGGCEAPRRGGHARDVGELSRPGPCRRAHHLHEPAPMPVRESDEDHVTVAARQIAVGSRSAGTGRRPRTPPPKEQMPHWNAIWAATASRPATSTTCVSLFPRRLPTIAPSTATAAMMPLPTSASGARLCRGGSSNRSRRSGIQAWRRPAPTARRGRGRRRRARIGTVETERGDRDREEPGCSGGAMSRRGRERRDAAGAEVSRTSVSRKRASRTSPSVPAASCTCLSRSRNACHASRSG